MEIEKHTKKRTRSHKLNMNTKTAKYFMAHRVKGLPKSKAIIEAGIKDVRNAGNFEKLPSYQKLEALYKDTILKQIGLESVAAEHIKNIVQDQDKGAKNKAIEMFLHRVEPEVQQKEADDQVIVVLSR